MNTRVALGGLTLLLVAASLGWTVSSAAALSHTFDEPHHLATGLEWWQFGTYTWWTENPPLPKAVVTLAPYLAGMRLPPRETWDRRGPTPRDAWSVGVELLYGQPSYEHSLMRARLGTLPFFLLTLWATFALAGGRRRLFAACLATALVATYPPLLGHAGLATTDIPTVATVLLFVLALDRWADSPSRLRAVALGAAFGLAILCKLTAPLVCGLATAAWLIARRLARGAALTRAPGARPVAAQLALTVLATFLVVWAGYRFSFGSIDDLPIGRVLGTPILPPLGARPPLLAWACRLRVPAPELWQGLIYLKTHQAHGHGAYLLGEARSRGGFWNFYPVGLALKSPLPFLFLLAAAVSTLFLRAGRKDVGSEGLGAGMAALTILALSMANTVNIGLRHVLIIVPLLAIFIAAALANWLERSAFRSRRRTFAATAVGLLLAANVAIVHAARPELIAYFNPLAGKEPAHALIDSDLDWGQDFLLLKNELRARNISTVHHGFFGSIDHCRPETPPLTFIPLQPGTPVTGWIVLSEQFYRSRTLFSLRRDSCAPGVGFHFDDAPDGSFDWLNAYQPVAQVGASLRLYYVPPR